MIHDNINNFLGKIGNFNRVIGKKSAVHIRKGIDFRVVFVAVFGLCVQRPEKSDYSKAQIGQIKRFYVVFKGSSRFKKPGILGVKAEND